MKKRILGVIVLAACFMMLFSCATTVNVRLTRPAHLDLNGAKTIAVLPFKPCAYYKEYNTSLGMEILINSFYQIFDIRDPDEEAVIESLQKQLNDKLSKSPYIKLISSDSVEEARKKGYLNPADVYLTGEVTYFDIHDSKSDERKLVKEAKGDEKAEYEIVRYWTRTAEFSLKYQVVDSSNDTVISYDTITIKESSSKEESRNSLPSAYSLLKSRISSAADGIYENLQPHKVTKSIKLLELKTKDKQLKKRMKAADELAYNNKISAASAEFQKIYEETGFVEAGYNAAVLQEALGNLTTAEKMMTEVYNKNPDSRVAKGLSDIQYEIQMAKRLKSQTGNQKSSNDEFDDFDDEDFDF